MECPGSKGGIMLAISGPTVEDHRTTLDWTPLSFTVLSIANYRILL